MLVFVQRATYVCMSVTNQNKACTGNDLSGDPCDAKVA